MNGWNCKSPRDYIEKSLTIHPSLFRDTMANSAKIHRDHAAETLNQSARDAALRMADDCQKVIHLAKLVESSCEWDAKKVADLLCDMGPALWVPAFHNAARLNCMGAWAAHIVADYPNGK